MKLADHLRLDQHLLTRHVIESLNEVVFFIAIQVDHGQSLAHEESLGEDEPYPYLGKNP